MDAPPLGTSALLTGATGFLGKHLAKALVRRFGTVHAVVRPASDVAGLPSSVIVHPFAGGMEAMNAIVAAADPTITFHAASMVRAAHRPIDIAPMLDANITFGTLLCDALCRNGNGLLVNAGTIWQHFEGPAYNPVCLYAATKQAFEDLTEYYVQAQGLRVIHLMLGDTYGPDDRRGKLIGLLLDALRTGGKLDLSPGEQRIAPVHSDDVVAAFLTAAQRLLSDPAIRRERHTVCGEEVCSIRELVAMIERVSGRSIAAQWGARTYRDREVMAPWLGRRLPGWTPGIGLEEGLRQLLSQSKSQTC